MSPQFAHVVVLLVLAGALFALGQWGRRCAEFLVPRHFSASEREHRLRVLRRGGVTCQVIGAAFLALALGALM